MHPSIFPFWILVLALFISGCQENQLGSTAYVNYFPQGVASGDPQHDRVLIWTRIETGSEAESVDLNWEIATDSVFSNITKKGSIAAKASDYFTVKVVPTGLETGTTYYYRFLHSDQVSPIGRTKTAAQKAQKVRLAIVNCSNYQGGYYNGYDAINKMNDIDAVIHLGDYIYESGAAGEKSNYFKSIQSTGRKHDPEHEILTLDDYRRRFKQYRNDPMLKEMHRLYPMINIWDDHETANNSYLYGAQGHNPETDGDWETRKKNALKAFFEWIPIDKTSNQVIYRSFDFGGLVNLMMLDTRLCCRTKQADNEEELAKIAHESTLVGDTQLEWIENKITSSQAPWNVFGNQVLVSRRYQGKKGNYISLDQWTGYPKDRTSFLDILKSHGTEPYLITTGNVHSSYHFALLDGENEAIGDTIAHEICPGGISSSNVDEKGVSEEEIEAQLKDLYSQNKHMSWADITGHGFIIMEFTETTAKATWYRVSTLYDTKYELTIAYEADWQL